MSEQLTREYINLSGREPDDTTTMVIRGCINPADYHWEMTGVANFPYALVKNEEDDPFAAPSDNIGEFGFVDEDDEHPEFAAQPVVKKQQGRAAQSQWVSDSRYIMSGILSESDRDKLLVNHNGSSRSARHILDGFTIENMVEAFAEGMTNENVANYLKIKPGQLKSWIAMSQQRMAIISRLKDILRAQKVDKAIDESLDHEVERVVDKADEAYERLKLECIKMRSKNALELDKRSRGQDNSDGNSLPVVNLGLQVNMNAVGGKSLDSVKAVLPGIGVIDH